MYYQGTGVVLGLVQGVVQGVERGVVQGVVGKVVEGIDTRWVLESVLGEVLGLVLGVIRRKGSHHLKKIYFAKKFHKTVPPPRRGFMKAYFFGSYILGHLHCIVKK